MIRIGCMANNFSWIARLHFAEVREQAEGVLSSDEIYIDSSYVIEKIENNAIIVITFAAMALESFFNDYAAQKLGDQLYSDNFENLRPTGKFQLISKFIFNKELEKGGKLFQLVDKLFKQRNEYVHNKSKDGWGKGMSEEEAIRYEEMFAKSELTFMYDKSAIKEILIKATDAIKAMYEVARFFEEEDAESYAFFRLLSSGGFRECGDEEAQKVQMTQRYFKIQQFVDVSDK